MNYLVIYDICNVKRLRKVAKYLENIGLRVQNSTFELSKETLMKPINKIYNELIELCEEEDKIFIFKIKKKQDIRLKTDNWDMIF